MKTYTHNIKATWKSDAIAKAIRMTPHIYVSVNATRIALNTWSVTVVVKVK